MLFEPHRLVVVILLAVLLTLIGWFTGQAWRRARRKDIAGHLDALLLMFLVLGGIAQFRLNYAVVDRIWGYAPLTIPGMYLLTVSMVVLLAALSALVAGRLRPMLRDFLVIGVLNAVVMIGIAPVVGLVKSPEAVQHSLDTVERNREVLEGEGR